MRFVQRTTLRGRLWSSPDGVHPRISADCTWCWTRSETDAKTAHDPNHWHRRLAGLGRLRQSRAAADEYDDGESSVTAQLLDQETASDERSPYQCDGRTHCSEMTSCEEAEFVLANCPGVKMDGGGDGVPRESQWCGGR
jgi:hypothetical protein